MIALRVYFFDNSFRTVLLHDNGATAVEVATSVATSIGLPPQHAECCALYEASVASPMRRLIAETELPASLVLRWQRADEAEVMRLVFAVRLHTQLLARGECAPALWLMATEAASDVAAGLTPCGPAEALNLAAAHSAVRWGDASSVESLADAVAPHAGEFLPSPAALAAAARDDRAEHAARWASSIAARASAAARAPRAPRGATRTGVAAPRPCAAISLARSFVALARRAARPCTGVALFVCSPRGKPGFPARVVLGVSREGLALHAEDLSSVLDAFSLTALATWGFHPGRDFYFISAGVRWTMAMTEGAEVAQLLHDHAMRRLHDSSRVALCAERAETGQRLSPPLSLRNHERTVSLLRTRALITRRRVRHLLGRGL
jgi:hypothetical protein